MVYLLHSPMCTCSRRLTTSECSSCSWLTMWSISTMGFFYRSVSRFRMPVIVSWRSRLWGSGEVLLESSSETTLASFSFSLSCLYFCSLWQLSNFSSRIRQRSSFTLTSSCEAASAFLSSLSLVFSLRSLSLSRRFISAILSFQLISCSLRSLRRSISRLINLSLSSLSCSQQLRLSSSSLLSSCSLADRLPSKYLARSLAPPRLLSRASLSSSSSFTLSAYSRSFFFSNLISPSGSSSGVERVSRASRSSWMVFLYPISLCSSSSIFFMLFSTMIYSCRFYNYRICSSLPDDQRGGCGACEADRELECSEGVLLPLGAAQSVAILRISSYSLRRSFSFSICSFFSLRKPVSTLKCGSSTSSASKVGLPLACAYFWNAVREGSWWKSLPQLATLTDSSILMFRSSFMINQIKQYINNFYSLLPTPKWGKDIQSECKVSFLTLPSQIGPNSIPPFRRSVEVYEDQMILSISCLRCELLRRVSMPESYFQILEFQLNRVKTNRANEQKGTMKTRAGCGCSKYFMARQVVSRLSPYAKSVQQKRVSLNYDSFLGFLLLRMQESISYLMQRERSRPGRTMSPKPSILNFITLSCLSIQGNCSLRGRSMLLATVTITSVSYTQNKSYKKSNHRTGRAILNDFMFACLMAMILNAIPQRLSISQCLVITYKRAGRKHATGRIILMRTKVNTFPISDGMPIAYRQYLVWADKQWYDALMQQKVETSMKMMLRMSSLVICSNSFTNRYSKRSATVAVRGYTPIYQHLLSIPPSSSLFFSLLQQCWIS